LPAGESGKDADACGFVRRVELLPRLPGAAQLGQGRAGVALGQQDGARRLGGHRAQERRAEVSSGLRQLVGGSARRTGVAFGQQDVGIRGEQCRPFGTVVRVLQCGADRRGRGPGMALRQPQQRQSGLGVPAPAARLPVRLLRRRELAPQPVQLGQLVIGHPRRGMGDGPESSSHACLASSIASRHAPCNCMIWARCTRHCPRYGTRPGCEAHQRARAAVHS
jgi:hypothetical protein